MRHFVDVLKIYLYREPVDFRKQINGLSLLVEESLQLNPFDEALFIFINRSRNRLKIMSIPLLRKIPCETTRCAIVCKDALMPQRQESRAAISSPGEKCRLDAYLPGWQGRSLSKP